MLEKILVVTLIGTNLLLGSCTKEESTSQSQIIETIKESSSPEVKEKVSKLKKLYKEKEYLQARDLAKEIIMMNETNLEANIILLHTVWIIRNKAGGIVEFDPASEYHDTKIFRRLIYGIKDPTPLLEEILKEPNLEIPTEENAFGKVTRCSTIHDEIKNILDSLYISQKEANEKNISLISRIKKIPRAWQGHTRTFEEDNGYVHHRKDIIIEGQVIGFGKRDFIDKYFILKDKFNQEIKVGYKNKSKLGEQIKVNVDKIVLVDFDTEAILIPKEYSDEDLQLIPESQRLTNKFDLSTPEKTLEQLIETISTKNYTEEELGYFLTKSSLKVFKTDENYRSFVKQMGEKTLENLTKYEKVETYTISEKIKLVLSKGIVNGEYEQKEACLYALLINENNKWKLHERIIYYKKEDILRIKNGDDIPSISINSYIELRARRDLQNIFYTPRDYSLNTPTDLIRYDRETIFPKEDARKNLKRCIEILKEVEENITAQLSSDKSELSLSEQREKLQELDRIRVGKRQIEYISIK